MGDSGHIYTVTYKQLNCINRIGTLDAFDYMGMNDSEANLARCVENWSVQNEVKFSAFMKTWPNRFCHFS